MKPRGRPYQAEISIHHLENLTQPNGIKDPYFIFP